MDEVRAQRENAARNLRFVWHPTDCFAEVCLQRYVEALPKRDKSQRRAGCAHIGSISHYGEYQ